MITFDEFKKVQITVGKILSAEKIPDTDKLLKLMVDFAEEKPRQIVSGIAKHFPDPGVLVGRKCMFVSNLEPRMIKGYESNGMLFAVSTDDVAPDPADGENAKAVPGKFSLLEPSGDIPQGTKAK